MKVTFVKAHDTALTNAALRKDTAGRSIISQRCQNLLKDQRR